MAEKTVVLTAKHRHAGRDYPAGAVIKMPAASADWLIGLGRAKPADEKPAARKE